MKLKEIETDKMNKLSSEMEDQNFNIKLYKNYKISICKPLIPLKIALFLWYGGASMMSIFISVFYKQRGLTLSELSIIYVIGPVTQSTGPTISGIIADKIGKSKPVLVVNLILTIVLVIGMLAMPKMGSAQCEEKIVNSTCNQSFQILTSHCPTEINNVEPSSCSVVCRRHKDHFLNESYSIIAEDELFTNLTIFANFTEANQTGNICLYEVDSLSNENRSYTCSELQEMDCQTFCIFPHECLEQTIRRTQLLLVNIVLVILFFTAFTICYRFMDVTAMELVKRHKSDFGFQRVFSISGILVFSALGGHIVDITTSEGGEKNYDIAFYIFIGAVVSILAILFKLEVIIKTPGKSMWKKSLSIMKNLDNIVFVLVLYVIGTNWGFNNNYRFWYLEELKGSSSLFGLVQAAGALYGLPFLLTSNFWVKKIGCRNIFALSLFAYAINEIGYSLLINPKLCLILEVTSILTYHLLWVSVVLHSYTIAPEGLTATIISFSGGIHYSIGKGSGGLIGGLIMSAFDGRTAYQIMSLISFTTAILYSIYLTLTYVCFTRKQNLSPERKSPPLEKKADSIGIYTLQNKNCD